MGNVSQNGQKIGLFGNERPPLVKCIPNVIKGYETFTDRLSWQIQFTYGNWSLISYDVITTIQNSAGTPINHKVFFRHSSTTSRFNTLYWVETLYGLSFRHLRIIKKVLRHFRHLWCISDVFNVGFLLLLYLLTFPLLIFRKKYEFSVCKTEHGST